MNRIAIIFRALKDKMNFAKEATAQAHNLTPADTEAIERVLRQVDADPEGYMQWKYSFEIRPTPSEYDVVLTDITEKTLKDVSNFLPFNAQKLVDVSVFIYIFVILDSLFDKWRR